MPNKTTVVIPNYNGMLYIEDCLYALYQQSISDFCVIVVDNGSTDGSREYVQKQYPQVTILAFPHNCGFCKAVNEGILAATTPYVILLNNDTRVYPQFVEALEQALDADTTDRVFSVAAKMLLMKQPDILDGAGDSYCALGWAYARGKGKAASTYVKRERIFAACGGAAIYRRKVFHEIGLFDEHHFAYLEDMDMGYRARIYGYQNRFEPNAKVLHAGSGFSGSAYNEFKTKLSSKNSIYVIYKNMPMLQIILNLPFLLLGYGIKTAFFFHKGLGSIYLQGLQKGLSFCMTEEAKRHKVPFHMTHLCHYAKIQWELWINMVKRLYS